MKIFHCLLLFFVSFCSAQTIFISNCSSLQNMQINNSTVIYVLKNDIDCTNFPFFPIASTNQGFTGTLDGSGLSVINLTIICSNSYVGIFSYVCGGSIKNLCLQNFNVTGKPSASGSPYVGALVGTCNFFFFCSQKL